MKLVFFNLISKAEIMKNLLFDNILKNFAIYEKMLFYIQIILSLFSSSQ